MTKAARSLSRGIELEGLLGRVMEIVIENAGAERGVLILERDGQWTVEAEGAVESTTW